MRRRERAKVVVLSSEEKYSFAKAMFEPEMEHLAGLSSPAFYTSLKSRKEIVKKGMQGATAYFSDTMTNPDENAEEVSMDANYESNSSDASSEIGPDEMFDTIKMIQDMKQSEYRLPYSASVKSIARSVRDDELPTHFSMEPSDGVVETGRTLKGETLTQKWGKASIPHVQLDILKSAVRLKCCNIPDKSNGATRGKGRNNQTKAKPQKLTAISLPDKNASSLSRLLNWANETGDRYHVSEILENYPVIMSDDFAGARAARSRREYVRNSDYDYIFVIPEYLVTKLNAVVEAERRKRQKPTCLVDTDSDHPGDTTKEIIAFFPGVAKSRAAWLADMTWFEATTWATISASPELFDEETDSDELDSDNAGSKHAKFALEATKILREAHLGSVYG
ncbi:hypothetical protein PHPALM_31530 [Phytophthora palmivora]|uniref:Uncharacterized protein n=1 Tax=Phytophthora palmivora TaxID=4796 RepID=A0A2P4X2D7_9STRA|nr:hypothetical protein PHPALM_31530 [Phytophthora palmivora]